MDLINIYIKLDNKYIWIFYLKDHFSKFSIFYTLENKKTLEIADNIRLFVCYLNILKILQYDNNWKLKGIILIFLKKYNIKLINEYSYTLHISKLVK